MSRIGKKAIAIPSHIQVSSAEQKLTFTCNNLQQNYQLPTFLSYKLENNNLSLFPKENVKKMSMFWGLHASNLNNIVTGLTTGFKATLSIVGVGYKAVLSKDKKFLTLSLGYSHDIRYKIPQDISCECPQNTEIAISSINKQKLFTAAAVLCRMRKYNPYKGKGIFIKGEFKRKKEINKK